MILFQDKKQAGMFSIREQNVSPKDRFEKIRKKLLLEREKRPRPERDDKVLTDWNGLMIAALARAAQVLDSRNTVKLPGKLPCSFCRIYVQRMGNYYTAGETARPALTPPQRTTHFLSGASLSSMAGILTANGLEYALGLTDDLFKDYWDEKLGGFYLTDARKKSVLPRIKENIDTALPSSNSVAMYNLLKLSRLTGNHHVRRQGGKDQPVDVLQGKRLGTCLPDVINGPEFWTGPFPGSGHRREGKCR